MTDKELNYRAIFDRYWQLIMRRKWILITPLLITIPMSLLLCFTLPKKYTTQTVILVTPPKIPRKFVESTIERSITDRLRTIRQQIFSRTRLEKIITEFNLYVDWREKLTMEEVVEAMKENITLEVKGRDSFSVMFQHNDPHITMEITNTLAQLFIEENLKDRENLARDTTQFLMNELEKVEEILEKKEEMEISFRIENQGSMPEDQKVNRGIVNQTMKQITNFSRELSSAQSRRIMVQQQLNALSPMTSLASNAMEEDSYYSYSFNTNEGGVSLLKEKLSTLREKYTDEHPEIRALKRKIDKLEQINIDNLSTIEVEEEPEYMTNPIYEELKYALNELDHEIELTKNQIYSLRAKLKIYQDKIEESPAVAQQLQSITRDYTSYQKLYENLQKKILEARQAEELEKYQKSEQFEILDLAKFPEKPFKPKKKRIVLLGFLLGLGLGGGLAFLLEYYQDCFYHIDDVESCLQLPVLATIPLIKPHKQQQL